MEGINIVLVITLLYFFWHCYKWTSGKENYKSVVVFGLKSIVWLLIDISMKL